MRSPELDHHHRELAGLPAVVKEITPTTTVYYYREPGGELLARQEGAAGKVVTYTVRDQFGNVMAGETAKWSEWRYLVEGDPSIIGSPTQNQPMDENGQDLDAHTSGFLMPTEQQWICAMPSQTERWVHFDQRITVNGWGASACADVYSHLPAFWRFRVKKWAGTDWNGNPAATASVTAW